jgi:tetraacyldisaccharide 4'-kinase
MSTRRRWARPLVPLYAAGLAIKDGLRAVGVLKVRKLAWPVVSVGSLSAGGAGKTPVVVALAKLLRERGWNVDVLSRGYKREGVGVERVLDDAKRFGDEPVMIVRATNVPVWVGADRFAAGQLAESSTAGSNANFKQGVHLLDDGFQHRQLGRTLDVVLITAEDLHDSLLPAGNLREPLNALRRADAIVIRQEEWKIVVPKVRALMRKDTPMWRVERTLRFPAPLGVLSAGLRPMAFCAIARPEGFSEMLQEAGCGVVEMIVFGDHQGYTAEAIEYIIKIARTLRGSGFVTTEKDAVKLSSAMRERLATVGPLVVITLEAEFLNTAEVLSELEDRLT